MLWPLLSYLMMTRIAQGHCRQAASSAFCGELLSNRPDEADELTCNCRRHKLALLAARYQPSVSTTQSDLRLRAKVGVRLVRRDSSLPEIAKEIAW